MSDQKISIDTRLAIQWRLCDDVQQAEQFDFNNAPAIQLLEVLETQQSPKLLKSISNNLQTKQTDLERLESKVDLLLLLFTRNQYQQQVSHISNYEVKLTADSICINTKNTLAENQLIELKIYFNQSCPEPLMLTGKVALSTNADTLIIDFCNIGNHTQSFLEKYIFRFHRNEIARIKQN